MDNNNKPFRGISVVLGVILDKFYRLLGNDVDKTKGQPPSIRPSCEIIAKF
jgi:hypothetical protein